jgi:adenylosuccinate lyase
MQPRDIFDNLSPLDHRYWQANEALFDALSLRLSETAQVRTCARVEGELLETHLLLRGLSSPENTRAIREAVSHIAPSEVYAEEEKTRHNIRALVNVLQRALPPGLAPLVHLGATSADILDTARSIAVRDAVLEVLLPLLARVVLELCRISEEEADTPQVGRTHGQHAVPLTFGFAISEYASRLGKCMLRIEELSGGLVGKLAGAVGSYNALSMSYRDPEEVERLFLARLGLVPSEHSTQLVEPEPLLRLLLEVNAAFGVLANLSDDLRNLQRSEIGEVREAFGADQVGSSTMPQKRNPWNSEHVKSLWKAFFPRAMTFFMDQISEHQRDLTNSASERFVADYLAGFGAAVNRELKVLGGLRVDRERMAANLAMSGGAVLAEPAYILLAESGLPDAHERLRRITLAAESEGLAFHEALARDVETSAALSERLAALGLPPAAEFFSRPALYRGRSAEKAREIALKYRPLAARLAEGAVAADAKANPLTS